jgi:aminoglycoside phosphotransferase (APT) family kinase protein
VGEWLTANVDGLRQPFDYQLVAGGRSNLTFRVVDGAGTTFVLRRPPLGNTLQSAHDMGREHRILSALVASDVPVPRTLGYCDDPAVNGASFYVMEYVGGPILRTPAVVERHFSAAQRRTVAFSLIDVLADLHAVDPDEVGLGSLGRKEDYIERQLRRWQQQWSEAKTREVPAIDEVHRWLADNVPAQQRPGIVHGDYRIDNVVYGLDGGVRAVLDWELCTLGDPLADLGMLLVSWVEEGEDGEHMLGRTPTSLRGFPCRGDIVARYAERTGFDVSLIHFYEAFGYWKLACIGEGVYSRYKAGVMGDDRDVSVQRLHNQVLLLAQRATELVDRMR